MHAQIPISRFSLCTPDRGLVADILDIDFVEIEFTLDNSDALFLTIVPETGTSASVKQRSSPVPSGKVTPLWLNCGISIAGWPCRNSRQQLLALRILASHSLAGDRDASTNLDASTPQPGRDRQTASRNQPRSRRACLSALFRDSPHASCQQILVSENRGILRVRKNAGSAFGRWLRGLTSSTNAKRCELEGGTFLSQCTGRRLRAELISLDWRT